MKKNFILMVILLPLYTCNVFSQQSELDTAYYDNNWKGVTNPVFATYYRVYEIHQDSTFAKHFRNFYRTGELQAEGMYLKIDKSDDSKSLFDGELITYYKSGEVLCKSSYSNGKRNGEFTEYYNNGLLKTHVLMVDGQPNGILSQFNEEGDQCKQTEMIDGSPRYDYYVISNNDGSSRFRISDDEPIWDSPNTDEIKKEYKDGVPWSYYIKNGLMIACTNQKIKDYGRWYQINMLISNRSIVPIDFNPEEISSTLIKPNGQQIKLDVLSCEKYMKKVRQMQDLNLIINEIGEGLAVAGAGFSTSTTHTTSSYNAYSRGHGNAYAFGSGGYAFGSFDGYGSYHGKSSTTSTTTIYDGAAAYQARMIASERISEYENFLLDERQIRKEEYLKRTTIYPGETITGYVNIKQMKGSSMNVIIDINGAQYDFQWTLEKPQQNTRAKYSVRRDRNNDDEVYY